MPYIFDDLSSEHPSMVRMMGTIRPDTRNWILSCLLTVSMFLIFCLSCDYLISPHDSLGSRSASFLELRVMWPTRVITYY